MATTALVTGASGFLGSHVVAHLREHGYRVIAAGRRRNALPSGVEHFVGDLDELAAASLSFDVVVHCAALSSSWGRWREFEHANVVGTRRVLQSARRAGASKLVHISSPSIYAAPRDRLNIREDEVDEANRLNGYIRSKIAAERLLRDEWRPGDPQVVVLRPRGLIGAGDPSLVPRLLRAHSRIGIPLFRDGTNLTDLTAVHNVALAARLAVEVECADSAGSLGNTDGAVFNITNGDPRPFRELADKLLDVMGLPQRYRALPPRFAYGGGAVLEQVFRAVPGRPEPPLTRYTVTTLGWAQTLDISRAREVLGYEPVVSIDQALEEYGRGAGSGSFGEPGRG
ncbi:Nucleoside-diphosphate-sugar epimerase [Micrococcales bacterium KH10]|nr:Nucleoside-diphosphate-sugar epimerase [Micrococcales bacterium KH10]